MKKIHARNVPKDTNNSLGTSVVSFAFALDAPPPLFLQCAVGSWTRKKTRNSTAEFTPLYLRMEGVALQGA